MFNPSAAPRWKTTINFFLFGMGVAATARCRNAGIVLMPIMATPPLFRKMRRETFIAVLLPDLPQRKNKEQRWAGPCSARLQASTCLNRQCPTEGGRYLSPLKLRRAQNQSCDHRCVHLLDLVVERRLQYLRIVQLFLQRVASLLRRRAAQ